MPSGPPGRALRRGLTPTGHTALLHALKSWTGSSQAPHGQQQRSLQSLSDLQMPSADPLVPAGWGLEFPLYRWGTETRRGSEFPRPRGPEKQRPCSGGLREQGVFVHAPLLTDCGGPSTSEPRFPQLSPNACSGRQCPCPVNSPVSFKRPHPRLLPPSLTRL